MTKTPHLFGVEIEMTINDVESRTLARLLTEAGIPTTRETYNHNRRRTWKIVTDGSCGNELVSPPIRSLKLLAKACEVLVQYETTLGRPIVDRRCGLHVHHDARDFAGSAGFSAMQAVVNTYRTIEPRIDEIMAPSRRADANMYCHSMLRFPIRNATQVLDMSPRGFASSVETRYYKVNLQAWLRHGTVEFRQHGGTINGGKICNWVIFTAGLMERARQFQTPMPEDTRCIADIVRWAVQPLIPIEGLASLYFHALCGAPVEWLRRTARAAGLSEVTGSTQYYRARRGMNIPSALRTVVYYMTRCREFGFMPCTESTRYAM